MFVTLLFCVFFIILWINFLWSRRKYYAFALKMPGPLGLPFIGIAHKVYKGSVTLRQLLKYARQYKAKTYFTWFGPHPFLYTMDPKIAEIILNSPDCINKTRTMDVFGDMLGDGLLTSETPKWNIHRKLLNPSFNYKVLLEFFPKFNKISREFCGKLDGLTDCGEVKIKNIIFDMTMRTTVATTMGVDSWNDSTDKLIKSFERVLHLTINRALNPLIRNPTLFRCSKMYKTFKESSSCIRNFVHNIVKTKMKALEQKPPSNSFSTEESVDIKKANDIYIDQAIKIHQRNQFTINEVIDEANVIVFAAYETSAGTLMSILMFLATYSQIQEKVFEEILTEFPDKEFEVGYENLKNLKYLDMCIKESLRVSATVPLIARDCKADVPISNDIVIPKGTQVCVDIFNIQRDEDVWGPTANIFNPDNFLPANIADKHKYSYMPFSMGPRNCIGWQYAGMVLKVVLAQVLRRYRFSTSCRFEDLKIMTHIMVNYEELPGLQIHKR